MTSRKFDHDREAALARAGEAGVVALVEIACDLDESRRAVAFARSHESGRPRVWASVGVHPHEAKHWSARSADELRALAREPRVVAIGEMGLDFHYDHSPRDVQRAVFRSQLALALELDLPAVLHVRDAHDEALALLRETRSERLRGVAHCVSAGPEVALAYAELGFSIAVGGLATFPKTDEIRAAAGAVPLERLLLETDCPFMAPVPHRGKRCEPAFIADTCSAVAKVRGISPEDLARATSENAARLFAISLTID